MSLIRRRSGGALLWLLVGLVLGGAAGAGVAILLKREKGGIPGGPRLGAAEELALVPPDALGFIHIRARDIWKSDALTQVRKLVEKAGPENLALLDSSFMPKPSTLDRATLFVLDASKGTTQPVGPGQVPGPPAKSKGPPRGAPPPPKPNDQLIVVPDHVEAVGLLAFTAPFDATQVRASVMPQGTPKRENGKDYWVDVGQQLALHFPSDTLMIIGTPEGLELMLGRGQVEGKYPQGPISPALEQAAKGGRHYYAGINAHAIRLNLAKLGEIVPEGAVNPADLVKLGRDVEPLFRADAFSLSGTVGFDEAKVDLRAYFSDDGKAEAGEQAVRAVAAFARTKLKPAKESLEKTLNPPGGKTPRPVKDLPEAVLALVGIGGLNHLDGYLENLPLERNGREIVASFELPSVTEMYAGSLAMLLPAVAKVRDAAGRVSSSNNLKVIGLAMHNFNDAYGQLPVSSPSTKDAPKIGPTSKLSWRVQILPFIEEGALYQEFHLDEDWNSVHNKKLVDRMPKWYQSPRAVAPPGMTYYKVFSGGGAIFGPGKATTLVQIADGTSNTIMAVEGGQPVIWTKPEDIPFDPSKPLPDLSLQGRRIISMLMADGSVRSINLDNLSEKTLKAAITMDAGDELGPDW